jgi:hypothetical protein
MILPLSKWFHLTLIAGASLTLMGMSANPWSTLRCKGRTEDVWVVLQTGVSFASLANAEFKYKKNKIPTMGFEFTIKSNEEDGSQKLIYRFTTLKRSRIAKKDARLEFSIFQYSNPVVAHTGMPSFALSHAHEARLRLEKGSDQFEVLDTFDCVAE